METEHVRLSDSGRGMRGAERKGEAYAELWGATVPVGNGK